jgi:hypothetical protein
LSIQRDQTLAQCLGSRQAAVAAILFWLGAGCALVTLVLGMQFFATSERTFSAERWMLAIPCWGAIATILGLMLRKRPGSAIIFALASFLLGLAFMVALVVRLGGGGE